MTTTTTALAGATLEQAMQSHRAGKLADAERLYRQVVAREPNNPQAHFLVGLVALQSGRLPVAVEMFDRATALAPHHAAYHSNLGEAHRRLGNYVQAVDSFLRAMSLEPTLVEATYNLGLVLAQNGEAAGALACFERAAALKPDLPNIQRDIAALRQKAGADSALGPRSAGALVEIATTISMQGRRQDALPLFRLILQLDPARAEAHNNLGVALMDLSQVDDAADAFRRAIELDPKMAEAYCNLGNALFKSGFHDDAAAAYRESIRLRPEPSVHSNLIFCLPFRPNYDARTIGDDAREWARTYAEPLSQSLAAHSNDRTPDRRLRIGYVSPDFRQHAQAFFLSPLLGCHDHRNFEIFCYANVMNPDPMTEGFRVAADHWRSIVSMDDAAVARLIREDRIDILVDLTMHMERNRLMVFAQKPAPIQVSWLAYPGTTGLSTIDYRVTDPFLDPPGGDTSVYAEESLRLPETFWCYHPLTEGPPVGPLPARTKGHVTFGCMNNFIKVNDGVLGLWARVLREVDGSTLRLLAPSQVARERVTARMASEGIDPARLQFVPQQDRPEYLATYLDIDIALDTLPYNGHTTSLDGWWMGVPVVTLVGTTVVGRAGLCQAMNLGLPELVATTSDDYVKIAVGLAGDLDRLSELRAGLRAHLEASPLMDRVRFTRNLEDAFRKIWRTWCEGAS